MTPDILIRPAGPSDRGFIIETWLRSARKHTAFAKRIPEDVYNSRYGHAGFIEDVVDAGGVGVACLPSDPAFIHGWAAADLVATGHGTRPALTLHYVYVKTDFRRAGVASALLAGGPTHMTVTATTPAWEALATRLGVTCTWQHPYPKWPYNKEAR